MATTPTRLAKGALTTSSATLYTVPASTTAVVTEIIINNTTSSPVTPTVNLGGTAFISAQPIPANDYFVLGCKQVLLTGETITALASAVGCNIFISGVAIT